MSDLKPVTLYCCKGCQHLHHEIITSCDCGTGCDPFEYEIWEARRIQPEASAPTQDLSAAIMALPEAAPAEIAKKGIFAYYWESGFREARANAAALASSANALSEGDRVDLENWNTQMAGVKALLECTDGELECIGEGPLNAYIEHVKRIYAAILQSQKGGNNG